MTASVRVTFAVSFFCASLMTPVAHDVQVPQHAQQHPQNVNGINIAAKHCTMHTVAILCGPRSLSKSRRSLIATEMHVSYLPQHPPQHMQHGMQQRASRDSIAQALMVLQQVNSSKDVAVAIILADVCNRVVALFVNSWEVFYLSFNFFQLMKKRLGI